MTPKQFVSLIEGIAEENGYSCTTDVEEGDSWVRGIGSKGCTIFAGDYYDEELSKKDFEYDKNALMEIRKRLWEEYLIVADRPIANGNWKEGCLLNINFNNNRHHWTIEGQKAYQIMQFDEKYGKDDDEHCYPLYGTFEVFKSERQAINFMELHSDIHGGYYRIDEIMLDDEHEWVYIDLIKNYRSYEK